MAGNDRKINPIRYRSALEMPLSLRPQVLGGFKPAADRATGKFSDEYLNRHYGHLAQITDKEDIDGR